MQGTTAAIVLIGNELLSGKVADQNAVYLIGRLRALGVALRRIAVIPDEGALIGAELRAVCAQVDHVFTSGGVGPTHDDITLESVAAGFDVPLVRDPTLADVLTKHFGARLTPDHLRMADVPLGTELIPGGAMRWPVMKFRNIYILPGIPEIFRDKFDAIAERFRAGAFVLRSLYLDADEGAIAHALREVEAGLPVLIGSYPRLDEADHRVRVTIESREQAPVDEAVARLLAALRPEWVVRQD